jgi:hypothetical protein
MRSLRRRGIERVVRGPIQLECRGRLSGNIISRPLLLVRRMQCGFLAYPGPGPSCLQRCCGCGGPLVEEMVERGEASGSDVSKSSEVSNLPASIIRSWVTQFCRLPFSPTQQSSIAFIFLLLLRPRSIPLFFLTKDTRSSLTQPLLTPFILFEPFQEIYIFIHSTRTKCVSLLSPLLCSLVLPWLFLVWLSICRSG